MSLWHILDKIFQFFILLLAAIVLLPIYVLVQLLGLPYTIYYYSPNWGLSESDMPAVQLYIDHFQSLHPNLISSVEAAHKLAGRIDKRKLAAIEFWPHGKKPRNQTVPVTCECRKEMDVLAGYGAAVPAGERGVGPGSGLGVPPGHGGAEWKSGSGTEGEVRCCDGEDV
jgi:hypothetical protein